MLRLPVGINSIPAVSLKDVIADRALPGTLSRHVMQAAKAMWFLPIGAIGSQCISHDMPDLVVGFSPLVRSSVDLSLEVAVIERLTKELQNQLHCIPVYHDPEPVVGLRRFEKLGIRKRNAIQQVLKIPLLPTANMELPLLLFDYRVEAVLCH